VSAEPSPQVSIVVPAYMRPHTLQLCLDALAKQDFPPSAYEIIVVDDGSADGTAELARSASVHVISQPNTGAAAARNAGARAARGEFLLFTDADCAPVSAGLKRLSGPWRTGAWREPRVPT